MLILGVHHCCGNIPFFNLYDLFILLLTFFLSFLSSDKKGVEIKRGSGVKEENIPLLSPFSLFSHYFCSPNAFREYFALLHHTLFVLAFFWLYLYNVHFQDLFLVILSTQPTEENTANEQ